MSLWRWLGVASLSLVSLASGCAPRGGAGAASAGGPHDLDADPFALLPPGATAVGNLDAHAAFASSFGPALGRAVSAAIPLPESAGLIAPRDIDRVVVASYPASSPEVAAILSGRFDPAKIQGTTQTCSGTPIVSGTFGGFATETVGQTTLAVLTPKTIVAGTLSGVQAVLDRVRQGQLARAVPQPMLDTLQTPGAQAALYADFSAQPIAIGSIGLVNLAWLRGLKLVRALADFNPPGLNVAATTTFADPAAAGAAVSGINALSSMLTVLSPAIGGARIQNLQVQAVGSDVTSKFAVDGASLTTLLAMLTRFIPAP